MTVELNRFTLSSLRNSEYPIFITQITKIVDKYQITDLHLSKPFTNLMLTLTELEKIKVQESGSALSNKINELDNSRDALINAIAAQVKNLSRVNLTVLKPHIDVLEKFLKKHGNDIASDNYNAETKRLDDLLTEYNDTPEIKTAATSLNLTMLFDQLKLDNTEFATLFMERNQSGAELEKIDTRSIRKTTNKELGYFFDAIEYCSREHNDQDYTALASELNDLVSYYKTQLKARSTRRNNNKEEESEEPEIGIE